MAVSEFGIRAEEGTRRSSREGGERCKSERDGMRWRGASRESSLGGKHLGFEVPVEPQGCHGCLWWEALFVCVGRARWEKECSKNNNYNSSSSHT